MKKSNITKSFGILLSGLAMVLSLSGCDRGSVTTSIVDGTTDEYGLTASAHGNRMFLAVHNKMIADHTNYITYNRVNYYLSDHGDVKSTDTYGKDTSKNVLFYTGKVVSKGTSYTREHVWACANSNGMWTHNKSDGANYVDGSGYKGGGSDLYHIRPCDSAVNTFRGNGKFYEFSENEKYYEHGDGGPYTIKSDKEGDYGTKIEPADEYKGDIARILMYIYVHYSKVGVTNEYTGSLKLTDVFNSGYSEQQIKDLMVKWNELDPVDETEKLRNDNVEKIQGNRNPFVDHPDYMARIFDNGN